MLDPDERPDVQRPIARVKLLTTTLLIRDQERQRLEELRTLEALADPEPDEREALAAAAARFPEDLREWRAMAADLGPMLALTLAELDPGDAPANVRLASTAADLAEQLHVVVDLIRLKVDQLVEIQRLLGEG